jgi:WD40 repeat protein
MAFSPDSERLVIKVNDTPDHVVGYVWSTKGDPGNPVLTLHGPASPFLGGVAWSSDGSMIALVVGRASERNVMVFDARTGERMFTIDPGTSSLSVAFSPDSSKIAAGGERGFVTLWEVSAHPTRPFLSLHAHETEVAAIAFSPDGRRLMTGAYADNETKIWNLASPNPSG